MLKQEHMKLLMVKKYMAIGAKQRRLKTKNKKIKQ